MANKKHEAEMKSTKLQLRMSAELKAEFEKAAKDFESISDYVRYLHRAYQDFLKEKETKN